MAKGKSKVELYKTPNELEVGDCVVLYLQKSVKSKITLGWSEDKRGANLEPVIEIFLGRSFMFNGPYQEYVFLQRKVFLIVTQYRVIGSR